VQPMDPGVIGEVTTQGAVASGAVSDGEGLVCEHFQRAAEMVARRWTPQIVRVLLQGPARYRDLRASIPAISDHLLSERLKDLEAAGLVIRTVGADGPVRVEYSLSEAGAGLNDVVEALGEWAERWAQPSRSSPASRRSPAGGRSR
jgi:DNA-binding HxlR family transcriptional regulator